MTDTEVYLRDLRAEVDRYATVLADADFSAPVEPCPGWTIEDLNIHVGEVHRWATGILKSGKYLPFEAPKISGKDAGIQWFTEGAAGLIETLAATDPATACWGFGRSGQAEFWFRRQLQEIFVHRIDLEEAANAPSPRAPAIAADGVGEVLEVFVPRMSGRGLGPTLTAPVSFICTDTGDAWTLAPDLTVTAGDTAEAVLSGPAEALLLWMWRRIDPFDERVIRSGDAAAIEALLTGRLTP